MTDILFLSQRLPFPPDKGDKIRSYRALKHLSRLGNVYLGCLIDEKEDWDHIQALQPYCAEIFAAELKPLKARLKSTRALLSGSPMSELYFQSDELQTWVRNLLASKKPGAAYIFSSAMGQYIAEDPNRPETVILDYVDVDSDKWAQYARSKWQPMKAVFAREARTLLEFDRKIGAWATACTFVSEPEAKLFRALAPELAEKTHVISNGIDTAYFSPDAVSASPAGSARNDGPAIVFTGRMDYWPNVDAAVWFANDIFPLVQDRYPKAHFTIAGAAPAPEVKRLAASNVTVTGRVDDIRPYITQADVVVAPMRIARGIQNKVLEAMALGKAVITTSQGLEGIVAEPGRHVIVADQAADIAAQVCAVIDDPDAAARIGADAREYLIETYAWEARMSGFDRWLCPEEKAVSP